MKALYGFTPTLVPFTDKSIKEQVALLKQWGCDAIFGGYDNPAFVEELHAQEMKIYAEFACFQGKQWWDKIPASRPTLADGTLLDPIDWYHGVNPSEPTVRDQLLAKLGTLVEDHELDGVWLDFIRWPCRWEMSTPRLLRTSFDEATLLRFAADCNLNDDSVKTWREDASVNHDYAKQWYTWRINQITSWVVEASAMIHAIRPAITLGLFAIPWRQADFAGAIETVIGQDFVALAPYIDIFSPMTYHHLCRQPTSWIADVTKEIAQLTAKPVYPVIQSVDQPTALTTADYRAALTTAHAAADGAIIFTLAGLLEGGKLATTQDVWQWEGEYKTAEVGP